MTLPTRIRNRRHSTAMGDSFPSSSESQAENLAAPCRSGSDAGGKTQSCVVGGVLKKFAKRNHFGKNFGEFLEKAYTAPDGSARSSRPPDGEARERSDSDSIPKSRPSSPQPVSDNSGQETGSDSDSKSSSLKKAGAASQCQETASKTTSSHFNDGSLAHEGAVATLVAMFEPPWSAELLGKVLAHNENNLTKSVDMILLHGSSPPEELLQSLSERDASSNVGDRNAPLLRDESDPVLPKELTHNLEDDVSALTMESGMEFARKPRKGRASKRGGPFRFLPIIKDEEQHRDEGVDGRSQEQINLCECMDAAGIGRQDIAAMHVDRPETGVDRKEPQPEVRDAGGCRVLPNGTGRDGAPSRASEGGRDGSNDYDTDTVGLLEAKVLELAGTLAPPRTSESAETPADASESPEETPPEAILLPREAVGLSFGGSDSRADNSAERSRGHERDMKSLKTENAALRKQVKELTEKLIFLQDALEHMLDNQNIVVDSVLKQRRAMEGILSETSVAPHAYEI